MEEFYEQHFENCDYCFDLYEGTLPNKDELIEKHTMSAYADLCDRTYDELKERAI